jgi:hypothetical protein
MPKKLKLKYSYYDAKFNQTVFTCSRSNCLETYNILSRVERKLKTLNYQFCPIKKNYFKQNEYISVYCRVDKIIDPAYKKRLFTLNLKVGKNDKKINIVANNIKLIDLNLYDEDITQSLFEEEEDLTLQ